MSKLDGLVPEFRTKIESIIEAAEANGITILITSGLRTFAEQDALYAKGRTEGGSIVTRAKAGQSAHNYGKAADFCIWDGKQLDWNAPHEKWEEVGELAESMGLTWGGRFKSIVDLPHIEDPTWKDDKAARGL